MTAAILCPGPTLASTIPTYWGEYDFVVAVTDAIFARAPISVWAYTENPTADKRDFYRDRLIEVRPVIWGLKRFEVRWRTNMRMANYSRFDLADHDDIINGLPYDTHVEEWRRAHGPTFHAIARLIARGVREIELFGCDLAGEFNTHPVTGGRLGRVGKHPSRRWENESRIFGQVQAEAHSQGIEIRRIHPALEHHLSGAVDDAGEAGGPPRG